jgi:hypothetical protein
MRLFRIIVNILILLTSPLWALPVFVGVLASEWCDNDKDARAWARGDRFLFKSQA